MRRSVVWFQFEKALTITLPKTCILEKKCICSFGSNKAPISVRRNQIQDPIPIKIPLGITDGGEANPVLI